MALKQHTNTTVRFRQQYENAATYLIPFLEDLTPLKAGMKILEIGCGEGGVLKAFTDKGCEVLGVDLSETRIGVAQAMLDQEIHEGKARFIAQNVYDPDFETAWSKTFDWILLKDTIEHIPEQEKFLPYIHRFLKPGGLIFVGFPPWQMPWGGHQQIAKNKLASFLPYYHLLPRAIYKGVLQTLGEKAGTVEALLEIKDTGISIERFERILNGENFKTVKKVSFLLNPIYKYKFGLEPIKQSRLVAGIPFLRNFVTTAVWYIISK